MTREEAARFIAGIMNQAFLIESHAACGYASHEDVMFWREQCRIAEHAFDEVFRDE